jgi:hypothetical protein
VLYHIAKQSIAQCKRLMRTMPGFPERHDLCTADE